MSLDKETWLDVFLTDQGDQHFNLLPPPERLTTCALQPLRRRTMNPTPMDEKLPSVAPFLRKRST